MLSEIEFKDKNHIVLDKAQFTTVMNRNRDGEWEIISLTRDYMLVNMNSTVLHEDEA